MSLASVQPLTAAEEAALREHHRPLETMEPGTFRCACDFEDDPVGDLEGRDQWVWPCSSARLIATLDAARQAQKGIVSEDGYE